MMSSMNQNSQAMPTAKSGGRKFRNDLIFILALLLTVALCGLCFFLLREEGDTVTVEVDGVLFGTYPLSVDTTVEIRTGEELNLLVIQNGEAFVREATCPDGICASHRPIRREGESIVCLPHKVVITVRTADASAPDVVA